MTVENNLNDSDKLLSRIFFPLSGWKDKKSRLKGIILILLTVLIFYILFQRVNLRLVGTYLLIIPLHIWIISILLTLSFPVIRALRWQLILSKMNYNIPFKRCLLIIIGVWPIASISPAKSGDLIKVYCLRDEIGKAYVAGSVVTERIFDLLILTLLSMVGGFVFEQWAMLLAASLTFCCIIGTLFLSRIGIKLLFGDWYQTKLNEVLEPLKIVSSHFGMLSIIVLLTLINWTATIYKTKLLFSGVGADIPAGFISAALPLVIFIGLIPVTFAGMGTRDSAMILLFSAYATREQSLSVSLLYTFLGYWFLSVIGIPFIKKSLKL